jgi:predicted 3-demethylubiquinone-9 3-methyltransferase (glyoxalase superfamily)
MPTISPALLFDGDAEEALEYYSAIFENAVVRDLNRYGADAPYPEGTLLAATLELEGLSFTLINGPDVAFTDAVSFMVSVDGQDEVDHYWNALTAEGEENRCGWLRDRWGLAWQIVPKQMGGFLGDPDPAKAQAAMQAMMQMTKIVLADMEAAAAGASS